MPYPCSSDDIWSIALFYSRPQLEVICAIHVKPHQTAVRVVALCVALQLTYANVLQTKFKLVTAAVSMLSIVC